jgi:nucleoside-diphosphate-sugar epimerase
LPFLILGAGFTGERVARRLEAAGHAVLRTNSRNLPLPDVSLLETLPGDDWTVLHSIPAIRTAEGAWEATPMLVAALRGKVRRMVYLSTTGVYGEAREVDETTPVQARTPRETLRVEAERAVAAGPWSSCILRPAAIYGPGRGAHVSLREGKWKIGGEGANFVSRIHVDDLATHAVAALTGELTGAWPVADEEPCTTLAITEFCCALLGLPLPPAVPAQSLDETRRADRRVNGAAVRARLGITLEYPSYRTGIPASFKKEEENDRSKI